MFEVVFKWNACRPDLGTSDFIDDITLRGYIPQNIGLTGEFISKLQSKKIRPLSIGDITSKICPTRRDVYYNKGPQQTTSHDIPTWGREAGKLVEQYYYDLFPRSVKTHKEKYTSIHKRADRYSRKFFAPQKDKIVRLEKLEEDSNKIEGDSNWLMDIMNQSGRAEFALKILNRISKDPFNLDSKHVKIKIHIKPKLEVTGINSPSEPDFVIPDHSIIGDIKSGATFLKTYPLTCAGYAIAYENEFNININWGVIYFVPTHTTSKYFRAITYPQVYFFPIDENLRTAFLNMRDRAYDTISKDKPPDFSSKDDMENCPHCKFKDHCVSLGLKLETKNNA